MKIPSTFVFSAMFIVHAGKAQAADYAYQNRSNRLLIAYTQREGSLNEVLRMIGKGADVNYCDDYDSQTPLTQAACYGNTEIVSVLLENGALVNKPAAGGETALWMAAAWGRSEVVAVLIDAGADINLACNAGNTPLMEGALKDKDNTEVLSSLITNGAFVNATNSIGYTALQTRRGSPP